MSIWLQNLVLMQPRTSLGKSDVSWLILRPTGAKLDYQKIVRTTVL